MGASGIVNLVPTNNISNALISMFCELHAKKYMLGVISRRPGSTPESEPQVARDQAPYRMVIAKPTETGEWRKPERVE